MNANDNNLFGIDIHKYNERLESYLLEIDYEKREKMMMDDALLLEMDIHQIQDDFHTLFERRLREKVIAILRENKKNVVKGAMAKAALNSWLKWYVPDPQDRKKLIEHCMQDESKPILYNTHEFFSLAFDKPKESKWVVQGLLQLGSLILLTAYSKTGKSLLGYDAATSVATGNKWLGRLTVKSNVLVIQNEESAVQASKKVVGNQIRDLYFDDPEEYERLTLENRFVVLKDVDIVMDLDYIFRIVEENNIRFVMCDSLTASLSKCGLNERNPELVPLLYALQKRVKDANICFLLIHHSTKLQNDESVTNRMMSAGGSSGISRANDGQIFLKVDKDNERHINAYFDLRDTSPTHLLITRHEGEARSWHWEVLGETTFSGDSLRLQNAILRLLKDAREEWMGEHSDPEDTTPIYGYTVAEIAQRLSADKSEIIKKLNFMEDMEAVEIREERNVKRRVYHIPIDGVTSLDRYLDDEDAEQEIERLQVEADQIFVETFLNTESIDECRRLWDELSPNDRVRIRTSLTKDQVDEFGLRLYDSPFVVGERVKIKRTSELEPDRYEIISRVKYESNFDKCKTIQEKFVYYIDGINDKEGNPLRLRHFNLEKVEDRVVREVPVEEEEV